MTITGSFFPRVFWSSTPKKDYMGPSWSLRSYPINPSRNRFCEAKGGYLSCLRYIMRVPKGLKRFYGGREVHFITCRCYHRSQILKAPPRTGPLRNAIAED